jgi:alpha-aminoadipic semialdehyde synthase
LASKISLGIRREDKNPWERRVPLIPVHARELIRDQGIEIWIQPSAIRVFSDEDYRREGVKISEDLSPCSIILAVKEIPPEFFRDGRVYVFFSHTIKGQPHNMPMLQRMIELRATLIDYERIVDEQGRRLVFFGRQAGQAGMIDTLWALGRRLESEGIATPFSSIRQTIRYASLVDAVEAIKKVGWQIYKRSLDPRIVPLVIGFCGYGHVSLGAQEIFDLLPFEEIAPGRLAGLFEKGSFSEKKVYKTVFKEADMVRPKDRGQAFELQDYYDHPEKYRPVLEKSLPYLAGLVNAIYWASRYPRFVTKKYLRRLFSGRAGPRLRVIGDLSCDISGGVECTLRCTDPSSPVFTYDVRTDEARTGFAGRGPVIVAVDNLPAEISLESSVFFSQVLKPFIPALCTADFSSSFARLNLPPPLKKAVILLRGGLTPDYAYMRDFLDSSKRSHP